MKSIWSYEAPQQSYSSEPASEGIFPSASGAPGYQPRGFPEAIRQEDFMGSLGEGALKQVETALKAPAYTLERPIALVNTLAQGMGLVDKDRSIEDSVVEGIRGIPGIGPLLSNVGDFSMKAFDTTYAAPGAVANSHWASIIKNNAGKPDSTVVFALTPTSVFDPFRNPRTLGDVKKKLRGLGWTDKDFQDVITEKQDIHAFGNKSLHENSIVDMGVRMALDPFNLIFAPSLITKAAKATAVGISKIATSSMAATAKLTGTPALGVRAGAIGLEAGRGAGVTLPAFSTYLMDLARGGKKVATTKYSIPHAPRLGTTTPAGWYRRTAVATTAGQVGLNIADEMTPDDFVVRDWMEPFYEAAAAMGERKPLSENQLFMIGSLLLFPWRSSAEGIMQKGKDWRANRRMYGHPNAILDTFLADKAWAEANQLTTRAQVRRYLDERFGSADSFNAFAAQILRTSFIEKLWLKNLGLPVPSYAAESLPEVGLLTTLNHQALNREIERALRYGELLPEDAVRGLERFVSGRGGTVGEVTSGVEYARFSAERAVQAWVEWEPLARRFSQMYPNGSPFVPGIAKDAIIREPIDFMLRSVDASEVDGFIRAGDLINITWSQPGIFQHEAAGNLARIMTRDGTNARLAVDEVRTALRAVQEDAMLMADYFASARSWEARAVAGELKARVTNRLWHKTGVMADDINPSLGNAEVMVMSQGSRRAVAGGFLADAEYIDIVRTLRADPGTAVGEAAIVNAADTAGINVRSAVQIALLDQASTRAAVMHANAGLAVRVAENTPIEELFALVVHGLKTFGGQRGSIILRNERAIAARGLTPNGVEVTFKVPKLASQQAQDAQWNELTRFFQKFGDRVIIGDTTRHIRVIIPDGAPKKFDNLLAQAEKRLGAGTRDRVYVRDIVNRRVRTRDLDGTISLDDAERIAGRDRKYDVMGGYLDRYGRLFGRNRGINVAAEPGAGLGASSPARSGVPDRTGPGARKTRYESERGRPIRQRTEEYVVVGPDADLALRDEWGSRLRASGLDTSINPGDRVLVTADKRNGAVVKRDGELIVWRHQDSAGRLTRKPDDFDDVIAAASEHSTWAHVLDGRDTRGLSPIDYLADHGWGVTAKTVRNGETIAWMVRDPSQSVVTIPTKRSHGVGGWQAMQDSVPTVSWQSGRVQAKSQILDPEAAMRQAEAAKRVTSLERHRRIDELDVEIAGIEARLGSGAIYSRSSIWRDRNAQRERLLELTSTNAARARRDAIMQAEVRDPGNFVFVKNTEDELRDFIPWMDESLDGNLSQFPPGEAQKLVELERYMRTHYPQYTTKAVPRHAATPYYIKQGEAYVGMMQGRQMAYDIVQNQLTSRLAQAQRILFAPVYAKELRRAYQQEMYNETLRLGATPKETNAFLKALEKRWEEQTGPFGVKFRQSPAALSPKLINDIAYGRHTVDHWKGFSPQVLAKNVDFADVVQRASSRNFRSLAKRYPAEDGQGHLGRLIEEWYGKQTGTAVAEAGQLARRGLYHLSFGYHILRFVLDPRWYAMNLFESDFLGMARYGMKVRGQRTLSLPQEISRMRGKQVTPRVFPRDPAIQKLGGGKGPILSVEESLAADAIASGWMDVRNLYGYIAKASALERGRISKKALQEAIDGGSPVINDLRRQWGDNPQRWVDELEEQLYRIDTMGARQAILTEPAAAQLLNSSGPASKAYQEFLEGLILQHQKSYQDIVHTFHGNVNRANIERIFNSPLLYWPLSYQLKTGKWMIDIMTKSFAGSANEMLGSGILLKLITNHTWAMENNEEYRGMFDNHPALWRALGMFLPMTPFDSGVMMARWTRYGGSWVGAQLGLWDQDPSYPQDVFNFMQRSLSLGPVYSSSIIEDIIEEFNKE